MNGTVNIHGKEYKPVAMRINEFRTEYPTWTIKTKLLSNAELVVMKAYIKDDSGRTIATGYAEENRNVGNINKTSALENCETSAIGRALAFFGLAGTEIASADEVANAIGQQKTVELLEYNAHARELFNSIHTIKQGIETGELSIAIEAWRELSDDERAVIWRAPTKGGMLTTAERTAMSSDEWAAERNAIYGRKAGD